MSGRSLVERSNSGLSRVPREPRVPRSEVLKRLGGALSVEGPGSPLTATISLPLTVESNESEEAPTPGALSQTAPLEEPCGLTPASLKHLKRQRDVLSEEKARLQSEFIEVVKQLKELKQQLPQLKQQLEDAVEEKQRLEIKLADVEKRAEEAEKKNQELEVIVLQRDAEIERLKKALAEQRQLTEELCQAAARKNEEMEKEKQKDLQELRDMLERVKAENQQLRREQLVQAQQHEEMKRNVVVAMAAAEKAMQMHQQHSTQLEVLRAAKLAEAINQKVELHIAVPKVTLTYNNAPPLLISVAAALGEDRLHNFLDKEVFPHFDPLWVRLDGLDHAPDGSSKKAYSSRMLDRLTQAVKTFLARSQGESEGTEKDGGQGCIGGHNVS
eukprot:s2934_g11.t1